jgi:hypothetical protein
MKNLLFIIFFTFASSAYSMSCFNDDENNKISEQIKFLSESYGDVHSIADCNNLSPINKIVCDSDELKNGVLLISQGEVYAYENATRSEVGDRITFNDGLKNRLNNIIGKEKSRDVAIRKLCYIIKQKLSDEFGGDFYYEPKIHEVISSKINQNGVVVDTLDTVIYLGKSCDAVVLSYKDIKSIWYNDGDQFVIAQPDKDGKFEEKYRFNHDDNVAQLNCQKPTN